MKTKKMTTRDTSSENEKVGHENDGSSGTSDSNEKHDHGLWSQLQDLCNDLLKAKMSVDDKLFNKAIWELQGQVKTLKSIQENTRTGKQFMKLWTQ